MSTFAKQLRKLMHEANESARELGEATSIPQGSIKTMLRGAAPRNMNHVRAIARHYGVSMEFMFFGEDSDYQAQSLDELPLEGVFDGWLRVKIERAVRAKTPGSERKGKPK